MTRDALQRALGPHERGDVVLDADQLRPAPRVVEHRGEPQLVVERRPVAAVVQQRHRDSRPSRSAAAIALHGGGIRVRAQEAAVPAHDFLRPVPGQALERRVHEREREALAGRVREGDPELAAASARPSAGSAV